MVVLTTVGSKEDAERIARIVINSRLAACAQVYGPITSTYWWRGRVEECEEWACLFKTKDSLYKELEELIRKEHPYEAPEIIALPIIKGFEPYLKWIDEETAQR